ncbi:protein kinase domain-containing protein [Prosthecobacter sp.]|uniref:protein kinase domain-containing protein n=1 Tax=Prosthecobacter sp. TaxID=1965333 RepID=UPI0037835941
MSPDPFLNQSQDHGGPRMPQLKGGQRLFNQRYELKQPLGAGGMGVVWLSVDHTEETEVALKFLPTVLVLQEAEMKRLREEVSAGKKLRHARIVGTYGLEKEEGIAAIVMEYVDGRTLKELLHHLEEEQRAFFEPEEVSSWMRDLCDALTYLHEEASRAHRDIKPSNIIVDSQGRALLMDFGISHRIQQSVSKYSKTEGGGGAGADGGASSFTLPYASPQQLSGRPTNAADDLYSLAATLYEMLTGTPPFFRGDVELIRDQIKHEPPVSMTERRQELVEEGTNASTGNPISPSWEKAVLQCLAKKREERLSSAAEFKAVLFDRKAGSGTQTKSEAKREARSAAAPKQEAPPKPPGPTLRQRLETLRGKLATLARWVAELGVKSVRWAKPLTKAWTASAKPAEGTASKPAASVLTVAGIVRQRGYVLMPLILATVLMIPLLFAVRGQDEELCFIWAGLASIVLIPLGLSGSCGLLRGAGIWQWTSISALVYGGVLLTMGIIQVNGPRTALVSPSLMAWITGAVSAGLAFGIVRGWMQQPDPYQARLRRGLALVPLMMVMTLVAGICAYFHAAAASVPAGALLILGGIGLRRFFRCSRRWWWISAAGSAAAISMIGMAMKCNFSEGNLQYGTLCCVVDIVLCTGLLGAMALGWKHLPVVAADLAETPPGMAGRRGEVLLSLIMITLMVIIVLAWMSVGDAWVPVLVLPLLGIIGASRLFRRSVVFGVVSVACIAAGPVILTLFLLFAHPANDAALWMQGAHWLYTMLAGGLLLGMAHGYLKRPRSLMGGLVLLLGLGSWKMRGAHAFLFDGGRGPVACLSWSADDTRLALSGSNLPSIWNSTTGEGSKPKDYSFYGSGSLVWSPENDRMLMADRSEVRLINPNTWEILHEYRSPSGTVKSVGWGGTDKRATVVTTSGIYLLNTSGEYESKDRGAIRLAEVHAHSWDGRYVAEAAPGQVNIWEMDSSTTSTADVTLPVNAHCLAWGPEKQLAVAESSRICVWNAGYTASLFKTVIEGSRCKDATQVAMSPNSQFMAVAFSEGYGIRGKHSVEVWDIKNATRVKSFDTSTNLFNSHVGSQVNTLVWNNLSTRIAAGTDNGRILLLDFAN